MNLINRSRPRKVLIPFREILRVMEKISRRLKQVRASELIQGVPHFRVNRLGSILLHDTQSPIGCLFGGNFSFHEPTQVDSNLITYSIIHHGRLASRSRRHSNFQYRTRISRLTEFQRRKIVMISNIVHHHYRGNVHDATQARHTNLAASNKIPIPRSSLFGYFKGWTQFAKMHPAIHVARILNQLAQHRDQPLRRISNRISVVTREPSDIHHSFPSVRIFVRS